MATHRRPAAVEPQERSLFERCLDLCSSQAEREKIRSLAVRLHLSESASEWAILLLHAEGRALFGPSAKPTPVGPWPQPRIERRVFLLLGGLVAGVGVSAAVTHHAPIATLLTDITMTVLYIGWAARSLTNGG